MLYDEGFMLFLLPALSYTHTHMHTHTAKKQPTNKQQEVAAQRRHTKLSLAKYRISNRLTGEYPQLIED